MEKFKAHILVVDDDDGIRELVKEYLSQNEYLVTLSLIHISEPTRPS